MDSRQMQVESQERITMEMSSTAERAEYAKNIAKTPADALSAEAICHEDLSTQDNTSRRDAAADRPVSDNEKNAREVSNVHKIHAGVIISSSMIPAHVTSVSGVTVGSIMLGDISLMHISEAGKDYSFQGNT
ncbi:hypothetical protein GUJ93_ZPchr0002g26706 [Zizania palustris]|uniref:Uncharacterized protein n=1 Tax=Zizania palustris TaxID=103762 RepID=A0A8J5SAG9_ZIZPA|nr:hypothetical protein GUJ93_ZPchr0002g26706 [Zizania palustris]